MGYWTLDDGTHEKSFQTRGFTDPVLQTASQAPGEFTVRVPGATNIAAAPPIAYRTQVIIRRNRLSADGSADSFSGGDIVFQGRQITRTGQADPGRPADMLVFKDAWWDLENVVYQQQWTRKNSGSAQDSPWFSRLNLFQDYNSALGGLLNNGQQIGAILDYAITQCGVVLQAGTLAPDFPMPIYPVRGMMCATAIILCLQPTPDAAISIDYSTTPPTFNCLRRAGLASYSTPYADGVKHKASRITPRYDLQPDCVVLQYQKINTEDGVPWTSIDLDIYPGGKTGQAVGAVVCPLDLRGSQVSTIKSKVTAGAIDPTSLDWWAQKKADVRKLRVAPNTISYVVGSYKVTRDSDGADITATWGASVPNELTKGEVDSSWMPISVVAATVSAQFTYEEYDANSRLWHQVTSQKPHTFSTGVKLTNAPIGETPYATAASASSGETAPVGLAQKIYESLSTLQWEGNHTVMDRAFKVDAVLPSPAYALNLTGGAAAWSTMNAMIQQVSIDFFRNRADISFGPAKHIAPGDLHQLLQAFRFRVVWDNPALQLSGKQASAGASSVGGDGARENTTHENAPYAVQVVGAAEAGGTGNTTFIKKSAVAQNISMHVEDNTGMRLDAKGYVLLNLADCNGKGIEFRETVVCVDGVEKKCILPRSDYYT